MVRKTAQLCARGFLMSRFPLLFISGTVVGLSVLLSGCGGSTHDVAIPPPAGYALTATALNPASVSAGGTATSTITVTPANGYTGTVTLAFSITGGGMPAPTISFNPSPVVITGTAAATSTLTVTTSSSTPAGNYTITVSGKDGGGMVPSNGAQALTLTVTAATTPGYTLGATALNPASVTAGVFATSTITVIPANGYTGSVRLSCSSVTGGTPAPVCTFNPSTVVISGTSAGTSVLTVVSTPSVPGGSYAITVTGIDAQIVGPSNGPQGLTLTIAGAVLHVVIIFQENRTPDNLFQGLCLAPNGSASSCSTSPSSSQYDIASSGVNSLAQTISLMPIDLGTVGSSPDNYDLSHAHSAFEDMCDLNLSTGVCKMDGADLIPHSCTKGTAGCPPPANAQFMYVIPADVQPYLTMAQTYTFADRMFQTNQGPSFPAHQFIISGTSAPSATSTLFAAENPTPDVNSTAAGCVALATTTVSVVDPTGSETDNSPIYPCFEHATLTDSLDAAGLTWRYYAPSEGSIWTGPDAIDHMCVPSMAAGGTCTGPDFTATNPKVVLNQTQSNAQILTDIASNQLQDVSWVIPTGDDSDHARSNDGCGPSWVTSIVNAIGNSPYWSNTVIILTWDDWGGWYDHVPPPQVLVNCAQWGCGYVYGFRVPLIVISPYIAKRGYISHVNHDFGSILKFIEAKYNLPSLGYADANALDDLSDLLNFTHPPIAFTAITPPANDATCKGDSAPSDPDDD
jgi:phospholipase C